MNIHIANLKSSTLNLNLPEDKRLRAETQLKSIAADPSDRRQQDAVFVLRELGLTGNESSTENGQASCTKNVQVPDIAALIAKHDPFNNPESDEFQASSGYVRAMIWMAQADENAVTGGEPFTYEDEETRALCAAWYSGWKRAKTVPMFWDLFSRVLSPNCKSLLGFDLIPRPNEVTA